MSELTHFNEQGRAKMVDVTNKAETVRTAKAISSITVNKEIYETIQKGETKKGDVFGVAQVAGIMAAKQTSNIIPMCHPLPLTGVNIEFDWDVDESQNRYVIKVLVAVKTKGSTGVEMEALTAASVTALTIYDMCKAIDKGMVVGPVMLLEKTGGKSGDFSKKVDDEIKVSKDLK